MTEIKKLNEYKIYDRRANVQFVELKNKSISIATATLPYGRSKGDINGDGVIGEDDVTLVVNHCTGNTLIEDEIALWCADVNGNGEVSSTDAGLLMNAINGTVTATFVSSDYYNNWTWDSDSSAYYYDIENLSVTSSHTFAVIPKTNNKDNFIKAEYVSTGVVRVFVKCCPVVETPCCILYVNGDGTGVVV